MKTVSLFVLLCLLICGLTGCTQAHQVESQAFVLAMGVDLTEDGRLELCARMPKIAANSAYTESAGGSDYLNISAIGSDYESALDALGCVTPRSLNLSQLKIIAFSERIAQSDGFRRLIEEISQTERLFSAARIVVCQGSAKDFVEALEPAFGTRLSKAISATFDYFESLGTVPASSLADLCYRTESFYSDPMTAYAKTGMPENIESEIPVAYLGAALFSDGRMVGTFDNEESRIAALIKGSSNSVWYVLDGRLVRLSQIRKPKVEIVMDRDPIEITVKFSLTVSAREANADLTRLRHQFTEDVENAIRHTQRIGTEPFGFAENAAGKFLTIQEFTDFDFKRRYAGAKFSVMLDLHEMST